MKLNNISTNCKKKNFDVIDTNEHLQEKKKKSFPKLARK